MFIDFLYLYIKKGVDGELYFPPTPFIIEPKKVPPRRRNRTFNICLTTLDLASETFLYQH